MAYIINKLLQAVLTVFLVSLIIFWLFQVIPGDSVLARLGVETDPALEAALREEFGLDKPPMGRYMGWISGLFRGDMGTSIRYGQPVGEMLMNRLPDTLALLVYSLVLTVALGLPLGIAAARFSRDARGIAFNLLTQAGTSTPSFFMAILLLLAFAVGLGWFDVISYVPISRGVGAYLKGLFLPALAIAVSSMATLARYVRSSVLGEMTMDYVRTARNKGISEGKILWRHVLRNSMIPVLTILGILVSQNIGGAIVIEAAFSIPGVGSLLHSGIKNRDLPLVQGISLYISATVALLFFLLDILYQIVDPRVGSGGGGEEL